MRESFKQRFGIGCTIAVFLALLLWPMLGLFSYFLDAPLFAVGDFAANDLLVVDAKQLSLLHGHYSRMGFYHPGPFYLYLFALSEALFVDLIPLFGSPMAAHSMAATFLMAVSLSLYFLVWLQHSRRAAHALLATLTMLACLSVAQTHYLTAAWTPVMLIASMIFLITGIMGWYLLNPRWALLALFGGLQLLHGHASFLALLPLMLAVTVAVLGVRNVTLRLMSLSRGVIIAGVLLLCLFLTPPVLNTLLHWPGDWPLYLQQADKRQHVALADKLLLAGHFLAFGVAGIGLLNLPAGVRRAGPRNASGDLTRLSVAIFCGASASLLLLIFKAIDDTSNEYLLFWFIPAGAMISAAGLQRLQERLPARAGKLCTVTIVLLLAGIAAGSLPFRAYNAARGEMLERVYQEAKQLSQTAGKPLRITLDNRQNRRALWQNTLALLSKMKRDNSAFACIEPRSWNISFTQWARCDDSAPGTFLQVKLAHINVDSPGPNGGSAELRLVTNGTETMSSHRATR